MLECGKDFFSNGLLFRFLNLVLGCIKKLASVDLCFEETVK